MQNSIAAGRRLAIRVLLIQSGVSLLTAFVFLSQGGPFALAALSSGAVITAGNALLAGRMFLPFSAGTGSSAVMGLLVGTALKWMVVMVGFYLIIGYFQLPPLPALCGAIAVLAVQLMGLRFQK